MKHFKKSSNKGIVLITVICVVAIVGMLVISLFTYLRDQNTFLYKNKNSAQAYFLALSGIKYFNASLIGTDEFEQMASGDKIEKNLPAGNTYQSFIIEKIDNDTVRVIGTIYRDPVSKTVREKKTLIYDEIYNGYYEEH